MNLYEALKQFRNKKCWGAIAGEGTGSVFSLRIGTKFPRHKPVNNPHLTKVVRENDSEFSIMVYSSWELFNENTLICDSEDSNKNDGPLVTGLNKLINQNIKTFELTQEFNELTLYFTNGYKLEIYCDGIEIEKDYENYSVFLPHCNYTVNADYKVTKEDI